MNNSRKTEKLNLNKEILYNAENAEMSNLHIYPNFQVAELLKTAKPGDLVQFHVGYGCENLAEIIAVHADHLELQNLLHFDAYARSKGIRASKHKINIQLNYNYPISSVQNVAEYIN